MADLNQPEDIKVYFRDTIAANHVEISHFYWGHVARLQQGFKGTVKKGEYVLYVEWPQKRYRDNDGSVVARLAPSLSVLRAINKDDYDAQDIAIEKCFEILNDIIMRMRREIFDHGFVFSINDINQIDPVYHYMIDNCIGCRMDFQIGDWVALGLNNSKWEEKETLEIVSFDYSNNNQINTADQILPLSPVLDPAAGNYKFYVDANDTLPAGFSLNEDTGVLTPIPESLISADHEFDIIAVGFGNTVGRATVRVKVTVQGVDLSTILTLSGTLADATEADMVVGGNTIIMTLSGNSSIWAATVGDDNSITQGLIDGISGSESGSTIADALDHTNVVRTSDTVVTITLPAIPGYDIEANEEISATIPANTQSNSVSIPQAVASDNSLTVEFSSGLLLDLYPGAKMAYSTYKLRGLQTNCLRVRRSSDDSEQDIGFQGNNIDESALTAFVGAGDGYVVTWYDQSGNGNDVTQSTTTNQPKIVESGTVVKENLLPAINWDYNVSAGMKMDSPVGLSNPFTIFSVITRKAEGENNRVFWDTASGNRTVFYQQSGKYNIFGSTVMSGADLDQNQSLHTAIIKGADSKMRKNGVEKGTGTQTQVIGALRVGASNIGFCGIVANYQVLIGYESDKTSEVSDIETIINDIYSIY